jgi:hypothetical protein
VSRWSLRTYLTFVPQIRVTYNCLLVRWHSYAQLNQVTTRFLRRTWANIVCWELYSGGWSEKDSEVLNADTHLLFQFQVKAKLKVKLFLLTPWKHARRTEVCLRSFLTSTLDRVGNFTTRPLHPRKGHRYPMNSRLVGPQWRSGWFVETRRSISPSGFETRTIKPAAWPL